MTPIRFVRGTQSLEGGDICFVSITGDMTEDAYTSDVVELIISLIPIRNKPPVSSCEQTITKGFRDRTQYRTDFR